MSALVVYFSRSGHTRQVAEQIARRCGADLEAISEERLRKGVWGYLRSSWQVLTRAEPPIQSPTKDPADYDIVMIGTPIWIQQPAPPVRTYMRQCAQRIRQVGFFCTEGGSGDQRAFAELSALCGKQPLTTLTVLEGQLAHQEHMGHLNEFVSRMAT
jgi:flavodoxin